MEIFGMNFTCVFRSLRNGEFPEKDCLLPLISKLVGYALVALSTTVKLPQILKIWNHKSVRGLSVTSFELEVVGYTVSLAYCINKGLPFSAFGEYAFLLIQAIVQLLVTYYFSESVKMTTWIKALLYCAVAPIVLAGKLDPTLFEALYASNHAIFLSARIPQIIKNFKNKSTGELSFLTYLLNFGGSVARIFTSLQEKAPTSILRSFLISLTTNGTLLTQNHIQKAVCSERQEGAVEARRLQQT